TRVSIAATRRPAENQAEPCTLHCADKEPRKTGAFRSICGRAGICARVRHRLRTREIFRGGAVLPFKRQAHTLTETRPRRSAPARCYARQSRCPMPRSRYLHIADCEGKRTAPTWPVHDLLPNVRRPSRAAKVQAPKRVTRRA